MQALLQRVSRAEVTSGVERLGSIDAGLVVFLGLEPEDSRDSGRVLLERVLNYRIFSDSDGRMNCSLRDCAGGLLLVSQFTLAADTRSGLRPSFSRAMPPAQAEALFAQLLADLQGMYAPVASGRFGADMQVTLSNDGPVTFLLQSR